MAKCYVCKNKFIPKYFLQKHCDNDVCKSKWRELVLEEKKQIDNNFRSKSKPIKKVSDKKSLQDIIYKSERIKFLALPENSICFIDGCNKKATTIEHRAGRGINYLNKETWAGCCLDHNLELENNPELSKKYQLSKIHGGAK